MEVYEFLFAFPKRLIALNKVKTLCNNSNYFIYNNLLALKEL